MNEATVQRRYRPYAAYRDSGAGWLGEVPEGWEEIRLKRVAKLNTTRSEVSGWDPDTSVSFLPMDAVGELGGLVLDTDRPLRDVTSGFTYFADGDVLVAKITPCFENGKGALATGLTNGIGFGTTELHTVRPGPSLTAEFLFYLSISRPLRRLGAGQMYGAGGQKRISDDFLANFEVPLPPLPEQRAITAFLDRETAEIDSLIAKKERLLELLDEKRTALISRAVTKGLDSDAPMKDSGVEWLGEVPEGWEVIGLTRSTVEMSDYRGRTPTKVDEGVFLVTARNVRMGHIDYDVSQEFISESSYEEVIRRGVPAVDDVLFTTEAPLGNVALVDRKDIALAQRIIRFRMSPDLATPRFTLYFMMSPSFRAQLQSAATGSTAEGIKASKLPSLRLLLPPLPEQRSIAAYLDRETAKIDALKSKIRHAIDLLKEYRTALISAAVTGKIDVRDEVAA